MRCAALLLLLVSACSASTGGGADCADAGNCPCTSGGRCGAGQTCKVSQGWRTLDCSCGGSGAFDCGFTVKDAGPCEPGKYCNQGLTSCVNETATCRYDCRCEYTKTESEGVWLCQDNCGAAKACPVGSDGGCALPASVTCRYWGDQDQSKACSCSDADGGTLTCG